MKSRILQCAENWACTLTPAYICLLKHNNTHDIIEANKTKLNQSIQADKTNERFTASQT